MDPQHFRDAPQIVSKELAHKLAGSTARSDAPLLRKGREAAAASPLWSLLLSSPPERLSTPLPL